MSIVKKCTCDPSSIKILLKTKIIENKKIPYLKKIELEFIWKATKKGTTHKYQPISAGVKIRIIKKALPRKEYNKLKFILPILKVIRMSKVYIVGTK